MAAVGSARLIRHSSSRSREARASSPTVKALLPSLERHVVLLKLGLLTTKPLLALLQLEELAVEVLFPLREQLEELA